MARISLKRRLKIFSSFWLWFAGALFINQIILIGLVAFAAQQTFGYNFASVMIGITKAIQQISAETGTKGLLRYQAAIAQLPNIGIIDKPLEHVDTLQYPGFRAIVNSINEISAGHLTASFSNQTTPTISVTSAENNSPTVFFQGVGKYHFSFILSLLFISLLLQSAIAAYWIATRITTPLQNLSDQATLLALGDELHRIEVDENSSPEIRVLSNTLNDMRVALDAMISDREQILESIAHDLRTPLSRLGIGLELIKSKSPAAVESLLEDVSEMGLFLNQFIELSKLNREVIEPWIEGNVNSLITEIHNNYARAGVTIDLQTDHTPAIIMYKPVALTRLIYNLIDNAIRHGAGTIKLGITIQDEHVLLYVENTLSAFSHRPASQIQAVGPAEGTYSSGLGLKIIHQFAKVHNATISESSNDQAQIYRVTFNRKL